MGVPFVKVDLHGLRQEEAIKVIDKAIGSADSAVYQIQLVHGYHRGTSLRTMIHDWVFENRAVYITELSNLNVKVELLDAHRVYIEIPGNCQQ